MNHDDIPAHTRRIVLASAIYDLVVTAPFATPWTTARTTDVLARIHVAFDLAGPAPTLDGTLPMLFANLMGSIVIVWAVVRVLTPTARLGAADTAGRILFSTWMAFALAHGASHVIGLFLVLEVAWAIVQGAAVVPALWARRPATCGTLQP